jgi:hypothetical protein
MPSLAGVQRAQLRWIPTVPSPYTPLPTQHYLFLELWNLTQSRASLEYFHARLRQYHLFLAGRCPLRSGVYHDFGFDPILHVSIASATMLSYERDEEPILP